MNSLLKQLPDGWTSIMPMDCVYGCGTYSHKDGGGQTGISSGTCPKCIAAGRNGFYETQEAA